MWENSRVRFLSGMFRCLLTMACLGATISTRMPVDTRAASSGSSLQAPQDTLIFVNRYATGLNNGSSWTDAYKSLQSALDVAVSGDVIWVATGIYTPTLQTIPGVERSEAFVMESGIKLFGGFTGIETNLGQRDWRTYPTVLSGDLAQDDSGDEGFGNGEDNSYHVVIGSGTLDTAVLDGFTIRDGNATGSDPDDKGGGIYNNAGNLQLKNLIIQNNHANQGGGMYNTSSSPKLINVSFVGNRAVSGGGLFNTQTSSPAVFNALFAGNGSIGSVSTSHGGGIRNVNSSATLTNCAFSKNLAAQGGGVSNQTSTLILESATFSANEATTLDGGGAIYDNASILLIDNSILWGNVNLQIRYDGGPGTQTVRQSLVQGGCPSSTTCSGALLTSDPRFIDADGIDNQAGTSDDNLHLSRTSSAIDAGNNGLVPNDSLDLDGDGNTSEMLPYDLDLRPRAFDFPYVADTGLGTAPLVDLGAYEARLIFVDANATGSNNGKTWATAFTSLQTGLEQAVIGDEIWVADGIYKPSYLTKPADPRSAAFKLKRGVSIYGGFASGENNRLARNWRLTRAILSGDLNGNDVGFANNSENSYHVVVIDGLDRSTVLDGFIIRGGNANGSGEDQNGGGIWNNMANPSLVNLTFERNYAVQGGGLSNAFSNDPLIINCGWFGNQSLFGGGIRNFGSSPTIVNAIFSGNSAASGGGVINTASSPTILNASFGYNQASNVGGGVLNNSHIDYGPSNPIMSNTILWGNSSGQLVNSGTGTSTIFTYGLIQDGCTAGTTCTGNLFGGDPLFRDVNGPDNVLGTLDDDLHLQFESEAIDAGDNDPLLSDLLDLDGDGDTNERIPLDPDGATRLLDLFDRSDTGHGTPPIIDMGAYEFVPRYILYLPVLRK